MTETLGTSFYLFSSIASAVLAVCAVYIAKKAIDKGLTYLTIITAVWTLLILAATYLWHSVYEMFWLKELGGGVKIVEYSLFVIAYVVFIWLALRILSIRVPTHTHK